MKIVSHKLKNAKKLAEQIRKDSIRMSTRSGTGHLGPALSIADIMAVLYSGGMNYNPEDPYWSDRDRFILSKGHGCLGLYSALAQCGYFDRAFLDEFCNEFDTILPGHPERKLPGVEANTGSLGHGIAVATGIAMAGRLAEKDYRIFVLTGDGELQEGSNWEAAMTAAHYELDNLVVIVDRNNLQLGDFTENISRLEPLVEKWDSFGWAVKIVDGHNIGEIEAALSSVPFTKGKPSAIIANTIKGKGLKFAENKVEWHYKVLTKQQYEDIKSELLLEELENE